MYDVFELLEIFVRKLLLVVADMQASSDVASHRVLSPLVGGEKLLTKVEDVY